MHSVVPRRAESNIPLLPRINIQRRIYIRYSRQYHRLRPSPPHSSVRSAGSEPVMRYAVSAAAFAIDHHIGAPICPMADLAVGFTRLPADISVPRSALSTMFRFSFFNGGASIVPKQYTGAAPNISALAVSLISAAPRLSDTVHCWYSVITPWVTRTLPLHSFILKRLKRSRLRKNANIHAAAAKTASIAVKRGTVILRRLRISESPPAVCFIAAIIPS